MISGFTVSITRQAKANAVRESYSRSKSRARIIRPAITQARVTDGVKPAIAANSTITGIPIKAVRKRLFPVINSTRPHKIATCSPETATMWRIPLILRSISAS